MDINQRKYIPASSTECGNELNSQFSKGAVHPEWTLFELLPSASFICLRNPVHICHFLSLFPGFIEKCVHEVTCKGP